MRRLLTVLILVSLLLAGCAKSPKSDPVLLDPSAPEPTNTQTGTEPPAPAPGTSDPKDPANHVPSAILAARNVSGVAPLTVSFTLNGTDADGDVLTWMFDANGDGAADANGTSLPFATEFTYEAGNYTANLTVDDGSASHTASINITVALPAAAPPAPSGPTQVVDGAIQVGLEGCPQASHSTTSMDLLSEAGSTLQEVTRIQFAVDAVTLGAPWTALFDFDVGFLYAAVAFFDEAGAYTGGADTGTDANTGDLTLSGTVPNAASQAVIWACAGPTQIDVHYEA